jgi:hypothetical protein
LTDVEETVFRVVASRGGLTLGDLARRTGHRDGAVLDALLELERSRRVRWERSRPSLPRRWFIAAEDRTEEERP